MEGFTLEEIAEKITAHNGNQCLPVTINAVKLDMGDCKSIWLQTVAWSQNEMRVSAVQELRRVRREAWAAFEKSKESSKRRSYEADPNTGNRIGNIYMTEELQTGDSRWLDVVMRSILEECRVLGLFPKEPFEFGTTPGEPKRVSIAIVLNTGGKSIEQFANFPVRGQLRSPEIIKPPDISLNSEDGRIDHGWSPFLDNSD
jgi:hypothetical protein